MNVIREAAARMRALGNVERIALRGATRLHAGTAFGAAWSGFEWNLVAWVLPAATFTGGEAIQIDVIEGAELGLIRLSEAAARRMKAAVDRAYIVASLADETIVAAGQSFSRAEARAMQRVLAAALDKLANVAGPAGAGRT